jgi:spore maturation protein CgeB
MVWGANYNRALCGAKVALCFLSKLNRDTYTRRCFEIPATKTLMLSEYSDDLALLYLEGVEVDYFRNKNELIQKIKQYVDSAADRSRVAQGGFDKVHSAGHDIDSRIKIMLDRIEEIRTSKANK